MSKAIKGGAPNEIAAIPVKCTSDEFENAIRKFGVVNACEWFGYSSDSQFTRETIDVLTQRSRVESE